MNRAERQVTTDRSGEILDRIKQVFARKGFEGASMQELAQAAQMSVGNFYRYFPSKDAIVTALVERDLASIQEQFDAAREADDKASAYLALAGANMTCTTQDEAALWSEIDAAAYRNPEIAALRARLEATVRENILEAMRTSDRFDRSLSDDEMKTRAELVMILVKGLAKKRGFAAATGREDACEDLAKYALKIIREQIFGGKS